MGNPERKTEEDASKWNGSDRDRTRDVMKVIEKGARELNRGKTKA
jgi:hypothetical protein